MKNRRTTPILHRAPPSRLRRIPAPVVHRDRVSGDSSGATHVDE
ncbi:hypothetical protein DB32_002042 [Sandaracinus amylolyticus]|uniref:Uncharacterized protein n=1 Tax=Sandaracinus amylolyticus TaxID=927083 RepID=A0A0F6W186_9BACT|nr:hypothetical protein DB32_002042 [Sandaracinus amylolyticus]